MEVGGQRRDVGRMFFADELAFWVGETPEVSDLPPGTAFGVSPAAIGSPSLDFGVGDLSKPGHTPCPKGVSFVDSGEQVERLVLGPVGSGRTLSR